MIIALAFRNIRRNIRRLRPMIGLLGLSFALLIVGNAVLRSSGDAFYRAYARNVSGDLSVGAAGEGTFTIFGSDALLVGEYVTAPTIVDFARLSAAVNEIEDVRAAAGIVSSVAQLDVRGRRENHALFGVDFGSYATLFPELELVVGAFPASGVPGVLIQEHRYAELTRLLGAAPEIGTPVLLTVAYDNTFTIREAPLAGVYRYPVSDDVLDRVALVDVTTARALNGYVYGAADALELPERHRELGDSDLDDLFGAAETWDEPSETDAGVYDLGDLESFFAETPETARAVETVEGAWNYLLISLHDAERIGRVTSALARRGFTQPNGYVVRDWRRSVGGTALIVWYIQVMFNAGLVFVAFGAAIIATNALVLSVLERTREIGSMRALGATRARVGTLIVTETFVVVLGSAILGIALGIILLAALNHNEFIVDNRYIHALFGGDPVVGRLSPALAAAHLLGAAALGLVSSLYPLKKALQIRPAEAIA